MHRLAYAPTGICTDPCVIPYNNPVKRAFSTDRRDWMLPIRILPAAKLPLGARKIKLGTCGADVKELQELLVQRGFFPAEPDGCYGYVTDEAVREFQAVHRLRCDGIVGPKVVDALLGTAHDYGEVYVVTHEKHLSEVAAKLAIPLETLASSNQTSVSATVYPGQRLKINRRILGAWLEKRGTRLRKGFPAISLLVYPAVTIGASGDLVQASGTPPFGVAGASGTGCPALVAAFSMQDATLWQRFLKRRDWWKTWASNYRKIVQTTDAASAFASAFASTSTPAPTSTSTVAAVAFETVAPRQSERRRILRFLRFLSSNRGKDDTPGNGYHHIVFSNVLSGAKPTVSIDWLQQLTKYCDYVIIWFDQSLSAEDMRGVLRRITKKVHAGKILLGIDLAARETVFSNADDTVTGQNCIGYFEAQARAAGAVRTAPDDHASGGARVGGGTRASGGAHAHDRSGAPASQHKRTVPLCHSYRYRLKGQWRMIELLDYQVVTMLCSLVDEMGLAGAVLRGLEQGDARLFRALSQVYALAGPGWGWERR